MNGKARVIFDISLLVFFGILAVVALEYNAKARAMPFIFGSGGFILVLMQTGYDLSPRVRNKLRFLGEKGASWAQGPADTEESMEDEAREQEGEKGAGEHLEGEEQAGWARILRIFAWLVAFLIVLNYLGYLIAVPSLVFGMLVVEGQKKLVSAAVASVVMLLFMYALFELVLGSTF